MNTELLLLSEADGIRHYESSTKGGDNDILQAYFTADPSNMVRFERISCPYGFDDLAGLSLAACMAEKGFQVTDNPDKSKEERQLVESAFYPAHSYEMVSAIHSIIETRKHISHLYGDGSAVSDSAWKEINGYIEKLDDITTDSLSLNYTPIPADIDYALEEMRKEAAFLKKVSFDTQYVPLLDKGDSDYSISRLKKLSERVSDAIGFIRKRRRVLSKSRESQSVR